MNMPYLKHLPYPDNLLQYGFGEYDYSGINIEDITKTLTPREKLAIEYYAKDGLSQTDISYKMGLTRERTRQIMLNAFRKIGHECGSILTKNRLVLSLDYDEQLDDPDFIFLLDLSTRAINCLRRAGIRSMRQLKTAIETGKLTKVRNLGSATEAEIIKKYDTFCQNVSAEYAIKFPEPDPISEKITKAYKELASLCLNQKTIGVLIHAGIMTLDDLVRVFENCEIYNIVGLASTRTIHKALSEKYGVKVMVGKGETNE